MPAVSDTLRYAPCVRADQGKLNICLTLYTMGCNERHSLLLSWAACHNGTCDRNEYHAHQTCRKAKEPSTAAQQDPSAALISVTTRSLSAPRLLSRDEAAINDVNRKQDFQEDSACKSAPREGSGARAAAADAWTAVRLRCSSSCRILRRRMRKLTHPVPASCESVRWAVVWRRCSTRPASIDGAISGEHTAPLHGLSMHCFTLTGVGSTEHRRCTHI